MSPPAEGQAGLRFNRNSQSSERPSSMDRREQAESVVSFGDDTTLYDSTENLIHTNRGETNTARQPGSSATSVSPSPLAHLGGPHNQVPQRRSELPESQQDLIDRIRALRLNADDWRHKSQARGLNELERRIISLDPVSHGYGRTADELTIFERNILLFIYQRWSSPPRGVGYVRVPPETFLSITQDQLVHVVRSWMNQQRSSSTSPNLLTRIFSRRSTRGSRDSHSTEEDSGPTSPTPTHSYRRLR